MRLAWCSPTSAALEADVGDPAAAADLYRRAHELLSAALGPGHAEVRFVESNHDQIAAQTKL